MRQQREREKPVSDRRLERRFGFRTFDVNVNPLMVLCSIGEFVDALLSNLKPFAGGNLLADQIPQFVDSFNNTCHSELPCPLECGNSSPLSIQERCGGS